MKRHRDKQTQEEIRRSDIVTRWYLYTVAFVAGAAVLAIEILGTRVLGPFYGVTIYLWSALITVTLLALSVGYVLGGRLADRYPSLRFLAGLLLAAGLMTIVIPWVKHPILVATEPLGLRLAVLFSALLLFSIPLTLLGMVSPLVIKIKTKRLNEVGTTVGGLYAVSTLGSVVAALVTGYLLIPYVGVTRLLLITGFVLVMTALLGFVLNPRSRTRLAGVSFLLIAGIVTICSIPAERAQPERGLLAVTDSEYGEVRVLDRPQIRFLLIDGTAQNLVNPKTWESYNFCVPIMQLLTAFKEPPGDLHLIGLGAGSYAKECSKIGWSVDAVEIDPVIIDLAYRYFGLQPADAVVHCTDGRRFLGSSDKAYDIITLDAFGSGLIPFHLMTREFFGLVKRHLKSGGILIVNTVTLVQDDPLVAPLAATLKSQFSEVWAFPVFHPARWSTNTIFLAANEPIQPPARVTSLQRFDGVTLTTDEVWGKRFLPDWREDQILTDDLNPADLWSEKINHSMRKELHANLGAASLAW